MFCPTNRLRHEKVPDGDEEGVISIKGIKYENIPSEIMQHFEEMAKIHGNVRQ